MNRETVPQRYTNHPPKPDKEAARAQIAKQMAEYERKNTIVVVATGYHSDDAAKSISLKHRTKMVNV